MTRRRALLIDLDGVLRTWPSDNDRRAEQRAELPPGTIASTAFSADLLLPAITGQTDDATWRDQVLARLRLRFPDRPVDEAMALWSEPCGLVDRDVLQLIRRVRARALVVLVTNATTRLRSDLDRLGLTAELDRVVSSAEVGSAKPDPRIFQAALRRIDVPPGDACFVDDAAANVDAAAHIGIEAHHYRGYEALRAWFAGRGLLD